MIPLTPRECPLLGPKCGLNLSCLSSHETGRFMELSRKVLQILKRMEAPVELRLQVC